MKRILAMKLFAVTVLGLLPNAFAAKSAPYDRLACVAPKGMVIGTTQFGPVQTFSFTVDQNGNRNYATIKVDGREIGMVSYQRSLANRDITLVGSGADLNVVVTADKKSAQVDTSPSKKLAWSRYVAKDENKQVALDCQFSRFDDSQN